MNNPSELTQMSSIIDRLPKGRTPNIHETAFGISPTTIIIEVPRENGRKIFPFEYTMPPDPELAPGDILVYTENIDLDGFTLHIADVEKGQPPDFNNANEFSDIVSAKVAYCTDTKGDAYMTITDETNTNVRIPIPGEEGKKFISALGEINALSVKGRQNENDLLSNALRPAIEKVLKEFKPVNQVRTKLALGIPVSNVSAKPLTVV